MLVSACQLFTEQVEQSEPDGFHVCGKAWFRRHISDLSVSDYFNELPDCPHVACKKKHLTAKHLNISVFKIIVWVEIIFPYQSVTFDVTSE